VNTLHLFLKNQPVNAVNGNSRCLFWDPNKTYTWTLWEKLRLFLVLNRKVFKC